MSDRKSQTQKYNKLVANRFFFTDLKTGNNQDIGFVRYRLGDSEDSSHIQPIIQTPFLKMRQYGVPQDGNEYYKTELTRAFLKLPLNHEYKKVDASKEELRFRKVFQEIDEFFGSDECKENIFGEDANRFQYQPIVRSPQELEKPSSRATAQEKEKYTRQLASYRPLYMKLKLSLDIEWNEESRESIFKGIKTSIFKRDENGGRTKQEVTCVNDVEKLIRFGSEIRLIIMPSKLWVAKSKLTGASHKLYGVQLKIVQAEVKPAAGGEKVDYDGDYLLDDSDEDDEVKETYNDSDDDNENNSGSDNEDVASEEGSDGPDPEPVVKPTRRRRRAA
jgi:hypothetical protein